MGWQEQPYLARGVVMQLEPDIGLPIALAALIAVAWLLINCFKKGGE